MNVNRLNENVHKDVLIVLILSDTKMLNYKVLFRYAFIKRAVKIH